MGLGALIAEPEPYNAWSLAVLDCWVWLGGWQPERLGLYLARQQVADVGALLDGLLTVRSTIDRHREEQRKK